MATIIEKIFELEFDDFASEFLEKENDNNSWVVVESQNKFDKIKTKYSKFVMPTIYENKIDTHMQIRSNQQITNGD